MSALPKQVRAQAERANKLAKEFLEQKPGTVTPPPNEADLVVHPTPAPVPPEPVPPPPSEPKETASNVTPIPDPDWKQKYNVLQGKYNAEVPRMQAQVRDLGETTRQLREQLTATQALLAALGEQRKSPSVQSPQDTPSATTKLIKDEERREFGDDLIDVMRRAAREEIASLMPEIDRRITPVAQSVQRVAQATEQVGQRQAQSDRETVLKMLDDQVPEWEALNKNEDFLSWLDQDDPYAGVRRGVLLNQAFQAHNGPRVVAFFKGYQNEHAVVTPTPSPAPTAAAPAAPQRKLESLVAPGTQKAGTTGTQEGSGKRVWTRAEIGQFFNDRQNSPKKYSAEQWKAMERDIFAAQAEGRIR